MQCVVCQTETSNPKFCSRSCAVTYNNHIQPKRIKQFKTCIVCNGKRGYRNKNFCSIKCHSEHLIQQKLKEIYETGIIYDTDVYRTSITAKKYITLIKGYKCELCGIVEWNNKPLVLVLDHINGRPNDWRVLNLRLVCPNCDSQLPTFKSKNSQGRPSRRLKAASG